MPNVGFEVTNGVGKVVQELHGMLELEFGDYICILLDHRRGDECH